MSSRIFKLFITILFVILPLFFFNSLVATEKKAELFHLDIDGDKEFDALTDGLLILRSMFGLTGTNLVSGAISSNAVYSTPGEIEDRIIALGMKIDIDNNGDLDALTDGLLILRYLFGLTGETLTNNVISSNAVRADSDDIESYMNGLLILNVTPVFLSDSLFSADENQLDVGSVVVDDREGDTLSFEVSGSDLTINEQGYLKFISEPDFEVRNNYEARVGVSDGTMTVYQDITVNVLDVNEGPVFFSDAVFSANENQILVGTVISRDPEGDEISYAVSGSNLEINSLGNLKFLEPPNYENKSQYEAVITASDGQIQTNQSIEISVLDENEAPIFQSSPIFSVDENILDIGQIIATDPEGDAIEYSISEGSIEIRSDGLLLFKSPPDYESESSYNATVTAFEGSFSASQNISVLINNVNERPSIVSNSQFYADENQLSIGAIDAIDPENDSLTFTITGDEINVDPTGLLTFVNFTL